MERNGAVSNCKCKGQGIIMSKAFLTEVLAGSNSDRGQLERRSMTLLRFRTVSLKDVRVLAWPAAGKTSTDGGQRKCWQALRRQYRWVISENY